MPIAICEVTTPAAPPQLVPQSKRIIMIHGAVADSATDVEVVTQGPIIVRADLQAAVTVSVVEVLTNGRQSTPCSIQFVPAALVDAVMADPTGFTVRVTKVE